MAVTGEHRLLIDGELVEPESGATYPNVNPATEEIIGQVSDAGPADMERAIAAARRAFDESTWATDPELRKRGLRQLQEALNKERETLRAADRGRGRRSDHADLRRADGQLHR